MYTRIIEQIRLGGRLSLFYYKTFVGISRLGRAQQDWNDIFSKMHSLVSLRRDRNPKKMGKTFVKLIRK